jgi:hypothetical protein
MPDRTTRNDATATTGLSFQLQAGEPFPEDTAWLTEQLAVRSRDWATLADASIQDQPSALDFDPRWHD